ncbi:MAG TPA: response regulator [Bryobacteraceae bacterium]|jgi:two-component system KDP operon response regulator KdpE
MTILVVDDDRDQRELRSLLLARNGFEAVPAADKASARRLAASHHPEAAVVDLGLPTIQDGLELIRDLKALDSSIRVVVLTGATQRSLAKELDSAPVDSLFIKPASTAALVRKLRSYEK